MQLKPQKHTVLVVIVIVVAIVYKWLINFKSIEIKSNKWIYNYNTRTRTHMYLHEYEHLNVCFVNCLAVYVYAKVYFIV